MNIYKCFLEPLSLSRAQNGFEDERFVVADEKEQCTAHLEAQDRIVKRVFNMGKCERVGNPSITKNQKKRGLKKLGNND